MVALKSRRMPSILIALCIFLVGASLCAADDFLDAYKEGLVAIERGQWNLAAQKMHVALAGRSEESPRLIKKRYFNDYLPHYFLGVALAELGDCEGALESWSESERQGLINKRKENDNLIRYREMCQARMALAGRIAPLKRDLFEIESEMIQAADLAQDPDLKAVWTSGSPSLADRQARAQDQIRLARAQLAQAEAQGNRELLQQAESALAEARKEWTALHQQAETMRVKTRSDRLAENEEAKRRDAEARRRLERLTQKTERFLNEMDQQGSYPADLQGRRSELARLSERAQKQARAGNAKEIERLTNELSRSQKSLSQAFQPPPADLNAAVEAYLSGDYPQVLELLQDFTSARPRAMAHAHLLRAAAQFALHRLRDDVERLDQARSEARAALEADPELHVSERLFSPRFRELLTTLNVSDHEG